MAADRCFNSGGLAAHSNWSTLESTTWIAIAGSTVPPPTASKAAKGQRDQQGEEGSMPFLPALNPANKSCRRFTELLWMCLCSSLACYAIPLHSSCNRSLPMFFPMKCRQIGTEQRKLHR